MNPTTAVVGTAPRLKTRRRESDHRRVGGRDAGVAAIEVVVLLPAIALVGLAIVVGAQVIMAQQSVQQAASDAARTASLARSVSVAQAEARTTASWTLANQDLRCAGTDVTVDTAALQAPPGQPAQVHATVACHLNATSLGVPVRWTWTITASMSSPVDTWRSR